MHHEFKKLLQDAKGESQHVSVVFLDVRGFSSFAGIAESTDTAEFLKSAYLRVLDEYFPNAAFFKPTGDGLLILEPYDRESLKDVLNLSVSASIRLVEEFSDICNEDPMINFDVPGNLGVGLARGSATALKAGEKVLDYSGRPLNLAARLMDLARPAGVVFDETFGYDLLSEELQQKFSADAAYVKGIAESEPLNVYVLRGRTAIPDHNKSPLDHFIPFIEEAESISFRELEERAPVFRHSLTRTPARRDGVVVHVSYPVAQSNGNKHPRLRHTPRVKGHHEKVAGTDFGIVDYVNLIKTMKEEGVKTSWPVELSVEYPVAHLPVSTNTDGSKPTT